MILFIKIFLHIYFCLQSAMLSAQLAVFCLTIAQVAKAKTEQSKETSVIDSYEANKFTTTTSSTIRRVCVQTASTMTALRSTVCLVHTNARLAPSLLATASSAEATTNRCRIALSAYRATTTWSINETNQTVVQVKSKKHILYQYLEALFLVLKYHEYIYKHCLLNFEYRESGFFNKQKNKQIISVQSEVLDLCTELYQLHQLYRKEQGSPQLQLYSRLL